jgi:hypothetical protein
MRYLQGLGIGDFAVDRTRHLLVGDSRFGVAADQDDSPLNECTSGAI